MRAYPINSKGEKTGESRCFSAEVWHKMKKHYGEKLMWREEYEQQQKEPVHLIEFRPRATKRKTNKNQNEE
jgi:hypothetical protein